MFRRLHVARGSKLDDAATLLVDSPEVRLTHEMEGRLNPEIDPRALLSFRAVAEHGSFAAAARALGWTQQALSGQVSRLERSLGTLLVTRTVKGVQLTEAGSLLLQHAEAIHGRLMRAGQDISGHLQENMKHIRVVAFPSACTSIVVPAMSELVARTGAQRAITIELEQQEPEVATELLRTGEADIALVFSYPDQPSSTNAEFVEIPLGWDPLQLIVSQRRGTGGSTRRHRLAHYSGDRWVAGCLSCRQYFLRLAAREGFVPDIQHTSDDYMVVQELVARGMNVSVVPRLSLLSYRHPGVHAYGLGERDGRELKVLVSAITTRSQTQDVVAALRRAATRILDEIQTDEE